MYLDTYLRHYEESSEYATARQHNVAHTPSVSARTKKKRSGWGELTLVPDQQRRADVQADKAGDARPERKKRPDRGARCTYI